MYPPRNYNQPRSIFCRDKVKRCKERVGWGNSTTTACKIICQLHTNDCYHHTSLSSSSTVVNVVLFCLSQDAQKYVAFMLKSFTSVYKSKAFTEIFFKRQSKTEETLSYDCVRTSWKERKESWKLLLVSTLFRRILVSIYVYVCIHKAFDVHWSCRKIFWEISSEWR